MKKFLFIIGLLITGIGHAQVANLYYTDGLNYNCDVFATATNFEGFIHKTTAGDPTWSGSRILLPTLKTSTESNGTQYQILFPFRQGVNYFIRVYSFAYGYQTQPPTLQIGLNATELPHNTTCSGFGGSYMYPLFEVRPGDHPLLQTGILTQNYASISIGASPTEISLNPINVEVLGVEIWADCITPTTPAKPIGRTRPFGLDGTIYAYMLYYDTVYGAASYEIEWKNLTTGAVTTIPDNASPYPQLSFTRGHTYQFRVRGIGASPCSQIGQWSEWSDDLLPYVPPPPLTTQSAKASLTLAQGCGGGSCNQATLQWMAIPGALKYKIEYVVQNAALGISHPPVTIYSNTPSVIAKYAITGAGWTIQYRIATDMGKGFGKLSEPSSRFSIR